MKYFICVSFFLSFSFQMNSQQLNKEVLSNFEKAKKSFKKNDLNKAARYLKQIAKVSDGLIFEEVAFFGANFYFQQADYENSMDYITMFFYTNSDESSKNYKEILLVYAKNLRDQYRIHSDTSKKTDSLHFQNESDKFSSLKALVEKQNFKESLDVIKDYFAENPGIQTSDYKNTQTLFQQLISKLEENRNSQTSNIVKENEFWGSQVGISPIFPGCSGTLPKLRDCFSHKIQQHFFTSLNPMLFDQLGVKSGKMQINTYFTINKDGITKNIFVQSPDEKLTKEISKGLQKLPVMKPAMMNNQPISLKFSIPFTIFIP